MRRHAPPRNVDGTDTTEPEARHVMPRYSYTSFSVEPPSTSSTGTARRHAACHGTQPRQHVIALAGRHGTDPEVPASIFVAVTALDPAS